MDNNENMQSGANFNSTDSTAQNQQTNGTQFNGQTQYNQQFTQPNYNQTQFQTQYYQQPVEDTTPLSVGQWMLTTLVLNLPCVGLIMAFVWAFGQGNLNRKNFCRSHLIWLAIGAVLSIIIWVIIIAAGVSLADALSGYSYYY